MEKRTVPSFASFKPRSAQNSSPAQNERHEDRDRPSKRLRKDHGRSRERAHGSRRLRQSDLDRDRHRRCEDEQRRTDQDRESRHERHEQSNGNITTPPLAQDEFEESEYFLIDRRGDAKNVEYGGLHRYSIPSYHRIGYGRVLGADRYARIDPDASDEKRIVLRFDRGKGGVRAERLLAKKNAKTEARCQRLILLQAGEGSVDRSLELDHDFIAFRPTLKRKQGSESPAGEESDVDYRFVEGKVKPVSQLQDDDLEIYSISDDTSEPDFDAHMRAHTAELFRATKTDPTNADAWLALGQHQARSTFPGIDDENLTSTQRRSVADIRLSVLDQALKYIPQGTADNDRVLLTYLEEGSKIWEAKRVSTKWSDALQKHPSSPLLWRGYLDHLQTDQSTFRYETCKEAYLKCLEALKVGCDEDHLDHRETFIYMLLRLTRLVRDCGYDELAIAIWQAVLEYQIFAPDGFGSEKAKIEAFGEFWESDVPRIGEEGALGWRAFASNASTTSRRTVSLALPTFDARRPFKSFAAVETATAKHFFLPAAHADEDDESDDPFRYIMFSDIKTVLERLPNHLDEELLIAAFLCSMNLPPSNQDAAYKWVSDPFLLDPMGGRGTMHPITQRYDSFSLFHDIFRGDAVNEKASDFLFNALSALTRAFPDHEELGEYLLAFLCRTNPSQATKTAKRLLKDRSTNLRYYNAYALFQASAVASSEQLEKAKTTWTKALELSWSLAEHARDDGILLSHSWVMTLIRLNADATALQVLLSTADGSSPTMQDPHTAITPGAVLKAKRHFEEGFDRMDLKHKPMHTTLYADCLAWLHYLTSDHDVNTVLQSFAASSARLQRNSGPHALELLHQAKARLIDQHMRAKRSFMPKTFRDELETSRRLFPDNNAILNQCGEVAKLMRLHDRLRRALGEASSESTMSIRGAIGWLFEIDTEIERCFVDGASATKDSVRAVFRRALFQSESKVKSCAVLWKRWFALESAPLQVVGIGTDLQKNDALKRTKEVFFDGLRSLPWSKSWIVDGMGFFAANKLMGEDGLRQIHDILVDRELRVRVNVDELEPGS